MRGRKPKVDNVVPLVAGSGATSAEKREKAIRAAVRRLKPRELDTETAKEWNRIARILAEPTVDRLKPRFVDVIVEYCRCMVRLRRLRETLPTLSKEIYAVEGRNGLQLKSHPHVAQMNEAWRQWRSLVAMLGLSPADERNMIQGQADLFDDAEQYFT